MSINRDSALILQTLCDALLKQQLDDAQSLITAEYPFTGSAAQTRQYSETTKTRLFLRDGFIDRYTGKKLIFIGTLRLISHLLPDAFPYHPNWKMDSCHIAYWELAPTLDHLIPIARGGLDQAENWVTTSMLSNATKSNWTLDELGWTLLPQGNLAEWDGLISIFIRLFEANPDLQTQPMAQYYRIAKTTLKTATNAANVAHPEK